MRRRDCRFTRSLSATSKEVEESHLESAEQINLSDLATEAVYQEELFTLLAREIALFPGKQRRALYIDLANSMSFEEQPTPLQKAFLNIGIYLEEYQQPRPDDVKERTRFASLLYHAYRRLAQIADVYEYAVVV
jgi:hypothetical protein